MYPRQRTERAFGATTYHRHRSRARRRWRAARTIVATVVILSAGAVTAGMAGRDHHDRTYGRAPSDGQASYQLAGRDAVSSASQRPVPIASLAKVMTAYLVLRWFPLGGGLTLPVTAADVADTTERLREDQSVIEIAAGETLTERQALAAILLPSANNVAVMLARQVAGSEQAFVDRMNDMARRLGMRHTTYTDPSGFDAGTRSTPADQLVLAEQAMRDAQFAKFVGMRSYELPVAGTVHNTDTLLGTDGFVGIKTGSDDAAGGCFMFRTHRVVDGRRVDLTGVVLGQHGHDLIAAGLDAARALADTVGPPGD